MTPDKNQTTGSDASELSDHGKRFNKWFSSTFANADGGYDHLPKWLKGDLRMAWHAAILAIRPIGAKEYDVRFHENVLDQLSSPASGAVGMREALRSPIFDRSQFGAPDDEAGIFIDALGRALVTWVAMQNRTRVVVAEAASAFNTTPEVICEAIEDASWICVDGNGDNPSEHIIQLDGE